MDTVDDTSVTEAISYDRDNQPDNSLTVREGMSADGKRVRRVLTQFLDP